MILKVPRYPLDILTLPEMVGFLFEIASGYLGW
jgi:hypothetical protein